ncbi:MAG: aspartate carbamoyltransferase [Candidatus Diapherotrites archaeon]
MALKGKNLTSINDLSKKEIMHILKTAAKLEKMSRAKKAKLLHGHILTYLFFEPSTRTRFSFEAAASGLGMSTLGFSGTEGSSVSKGESLEDTIKVVSGYSDIIVMRHPEEFSANKAAKVSSVPLVNGGDGTNEHPTQTLLDLYTIKKECKKLDGLKIGIVGALKYYRAANSLVRGLSNFKNEIYLISHENTKMRKEFTDDLRKSKVKFTETEDLEKVLSQLDILYVTRLAKERFSDVEGYKHYEGQYVITKDLLKKTKPKLKIMHPLPRIDEIKKDVDETKHAVYFEQAKNGIPVRQALICELLGKKI